MYSFHGNIIILKGGIAMKQETNYSSPYELDGKLPLKTAFPLGLQHVLAMFAGNLTPILLIAGACGITAGSAEQVAILQNAMLVAGIVTLVQLFSIGPVGGKLPIVMGTSSGFIGVCQSVAGVKMCIRDRSRSSHPYPRQSPHGKSLPESRFWQTLPPSWQSVPSPA